ncbi:acyl transferase [Belliella kenyensis]|uniref:Acyl transferase n=1 Tax=Belliella kenyensis TaxID=1472724 RepID=A0ABV8ESW5_9BACT|nr:acyl transferase [Belliella kenyensis]MCH7402173.1 acyl transferase [Belliella kenyensis]MDN3601688.1 acyl transferase [Belliella kenyensis]
MNYFKSFSECLVNISSLDFDQKALELFQFQAIHNSIYKKYLSFRNIDSSSIKSLDQIPFLPIQFFKDHQVITGPMEDYSRYFSSSGTTGMVTSKHYIWSEEFYLQHALRLFESKYGKIQSYHVLALLPAYLERPGSSLVAMAQYFIKQSQSAHSGTYLYDHERLVGKLEELKSDTRKVLLLGVTFALLDIAESNVNIPEMENLIVMETGGMKGRRREMIRQELHEILTQSFKVDAIHSEYGMTELMSQAYSTGHGKYSLPDSMKVLIRDANDPYAIAQKSQGGINVIDLANFHSCAFIETKDLGKIDENGSLEVLGRFDNSDIRGCNLLLN